MVICQKKDICHKYNWPHSDCDEMCEKLEMLLALDPSKGEWGTDLAIPDRPGYDPNLTSFLTVQNTFL